MAMIETLPIPIARSDLRVSAVALTGFAGFQQEIVGQSRIVWSEHCSECAYPYCYKACAFYTPRADLNCRRFEAGIEPVADGTGAFRLNRIRFRRWGKLEGRGTTAVQPVARIERAHANDTRIGSALAAAPAPFALKRKLAARWNAHKTTLAARKGALTPDAFVVECWAADGASHALTLTLLNTGDAAGQLFQARFEAGPDYQRLTVPVREIADHVDLAAPFLVQIEPVGEAAGRDVVFGVCDFVTWKTALASRPDDSRPVKVVVWDLDETLWSGILAEEGIAGVRPRPEAVAAIQALDERGVLQSIASKNDAAEAMAALAHFGLDGFFLHPQIHWGPKSQSMAAIAAALDLGVDSFVFIDDQPFDRAEVAARHPAVRLLAHTEVADLVRHPWFDLPATAESRQRRGMYQAEAARAAAFQSTGEDYLDFLRGCAIQVSVRSLDAADAERVYELSQRTNQLNFRGSKFGREAVTAMLASEPGRLHLSICCADRFGDYGLIGFVVLDLMAGEITDFFMSCRVQRKRVEHALFAWIAGEARAHGHATLSVRHRPSERNGASRAMLTELGFAPDGEGVEQIWRRNLAHPFADAEVAALAAEVSIEAF
jgi:FkbH-like protein